MTDQVFRFFGGDPVIAWLLVLAACFALSAGYVLIEGRRVERRKEEDRAKSARIAAANRESKNWPIPPGPKGFKKGRAA